MSRVFPLISSALSAVASGPAPDLAAVAVDPSASADRVGVVRWTAAIDLREARAFALATGGSLVAIPDPATNDRIRCLRNSRTLGLGPCEGPWIGLERSAAPPPGASWRWSDGSQPVFFAWADQAPSTSVRIAAAAALLADGSWFDSLHSPEAGSEIRAAAIAWPAASDADGDGRPDALVATGILTVLVPSGECGGHRADLDGNGRVDSADLAIVLAGWGTAEEIPDIDDDGTVGPLDLGIVLAAWTGE